jgi:hypothetical protein
VQYTIFVLMAPALAGISIVSAFLAFGHRETAGAREIALNLLLATGFIFTNTLELVTTTEAEKIFWASKGYLFMSFIPVAWMAFALAYVGSEESFRKRLLAALAIPATFTAILGNVDAFRPFIWKSYQFVPVETDRKSVV